MLKVLIVDDEPVICSFLEAHYQKEGFETLKAQNGSDALTICNNNMPDLIITDIRMPVCAGEEFIRKLNKENQALSPVIICMSAYSDLEQSTAYEMGVDAIFKKPFRIKDLMCASQRFLGIKNELKSLKKIKVMEDSNINSDLKNNILAELLANVSHTVNNKLSYIVGISKIIQNYFERNDELSQDEINKVKDYNEKIGQYALSSSRIIKSLKILSKNQGNQNFEIISISIIIGWAMDLMGSELKIANIKTYIDINDFLTIKCLPEKTLLVFLSLIQNSIDFTEGNTERWIRINAFEKNDSIFVAIKDSGIGIDPNIRNKIMNPFFTTRKSSLGLGLSISQKLMESQGGKIWLDETNENTCFQLEFKKKLMI